MYNRLNIIYINYTSIFNSTAIKNILIYMIISTLLHNSTYSNPIYHPLAHCQFTGKRTTYYNLLQLLPFSQDILPLTNQPHINTKTYDVILKPPIRVQPHTIERYNHLPSCLVINAQSLNW